jgi:hypothetical protein
VDIKEQVRIIEAQIHSKHANFSLLEKMQYLIEFFGNDPDYSKEAMDIVRSNICIDMKQHGRK